MCRLQGLQVSLVTSPTLTVFHLPAADNLMNSTHNTTINPTINDLKVMYTNCRSLPPKINDFRTLVSSEKLHILAICEPWLDSSIADTELHIPDYKIVRWDRDRPGGGIALYISTDIGQLYYSQTPFSQTHSNKLLCVVFYGPPITTGIIHRGTPTIKVQKLYLSRRF